MDRAYGPLEGKALGAVVLLALLGLLEATVAVSLLALIG